MDLNFTDEEVNRLIEYISKHTILYVQGSNSNDNKQKRENLWTEISQAINKSGALVNFCIFAQTSNVFCFYIVQQCKQKWRIIRDGAGRKMRAGQQLDPNLNFLTAVVKRRFAVIFRDFFTNIRPRIDRIYIYRNKDNHDASKKVKSESPVTVAADPLVITAQSDETSTSSATTTSVNHTRRDLEAFFHAIATTMSEFPPVDIVNMKMKIFSMVGAKELELLNHQRTDYEFSPFQLENANVGESDEQTEEFENMEKVQFTEDAKSTEEEQFEENQSIDEHVHFKSGIHRIVFKNL